MSLLLVAALNLTGTVIPACSWDRPGINPFMGDVVAAVDRYRDIPDGVRATLKSRIAARKYDEIATITRDGVLGAYRYDALRDMHFGDGTICRSVTRDKWKDGTQERGLVYCEKGHCLIVPTVCRNVSRISRVPMQEARSETAYGPPEASPEITFLAGSSSDLGELQFEPPSAGRSFASGLSDHASALPTDSASGLAYGSGEPAPGESGPSWAGLGGLVSPGVPVSPALGPGLPIAGMPFPGANEPKGLPGVAAVVGVTPVPEPSTVALLAIGLALVAGAGWRRARG